MCLTAGSEHCLIIQGSHAETQGEDDLNDSQEQNELDDSGEEDDSTIENDLDDSRKEDDSRIGDDDLDDFWEENYPKS